MKKNTLRMIASVILTFLMLFMAAGCKVNVNADTQTENSAGQTETVPAESYVGSWVEAGGGSTLLTIEAANKKDEYTVVISGGSNGGTLTARYSDGSLSYTGSEQADISDGVFNYDPSTGRLTWIQIKILDSLDDINDISAILSASDEPVVTVDFIRADNGSADSGNSD